MQATYTRRTTEQLQCKNYYTMRAFICFHSWDVIVLGIVPDSPQKHDHLDFYKRYIWPVFDTRIGTCKQPIRHAGCRNQMFAFGIKILCPTSIFHSLTELPVPLYSFFFCLFHRLPFSAPFLSLYTLYLLCNSMPAYVNQLLLVTEKLPLFFLFSSYPKSNT